ITHLVEVAIHMTLYVRQIYPADLSELPIMPGNTLFRHPASNEYISGTVKVVSDDLVVVVVKDRNQVALDRFIFSVQNMVEIESYN
ncbi:hypothetical protein CY34DRAFT_67975, partial [Suillus luteus UH-Slu-Lm8-n1]